MELKIALAGNPNSGKTTLFNALTGGNQYVGNWPGVTVEKKEGLYKKDKSLRIVDLPGIYSLSPYTLEEVVARDYLLNEKPDAVINIIDGTNLERNLYLTTQLRELSIPVVVAINKSDINDKRNVRLNIKELERNFGCRFLCISAAKGDGITELIDMVKDVSVKSSGLMPIHNFSGKLEHALAHIEDLIKEYLPHKEQEKWYSLKLFERDENILKRLEIDDKTQEAIEATIKEAEREFDDDSESIVTNERYVYIAEAMKSSYIKERKDALTTSDRIDKIVTNRILALPIFAGIIFLIYYIAITTVGSLITDWTNDVFATAWIQEPLGIWLSQTSTPLWLQGLLTEGIVGGAGAVIGFVPQILVLFLLLGVLEDCGYMARIAFILDRLFRKFGLSGKSFIPMLISTGCAIPGIMACRTIENDRDRRMTITTTSFMPCGAKLPIIALIAGALFGNAGWVATSAYFLGIGSIIVSGIILKKTQRFKGDPAPFIMELPEYHLPRLKAVLSRMWERGWSFIKKAGTIIVLSSILIWFTSSYSWSLMPVENFEGSILSSIGNLFAWLLKPLGFGNSKAATATILGLVAKENILAAFGILYGYQGELSDAGNEIWSNLQAEYTALSAYSFMAFNLLCAPCFAAIGAIRREMNSAKWTWFAIIYQTGFAYCISLMIYQFGLLFTGSLNPLGLLAATIVLIFMLYRLFKGDKENIKEINKITLTSCGGNCAGCKGCK
jgi:ferrous iron transport protein B